MPEVDKHNEVIDNTEVTDPRDLLVLMRVNGKTTANLDKIRKQWHQHFHEILNVPSKFNQEVIDKLATPLPLLHGTG